MSTFDSPLILEEIQTNQDRLAMPLTRILRKGSISFSGIRDIRASLKRLSIGSVLGMGELISCQFLLDCAARVKAFSRNLDVDTPEDSLDGFFEALEPLTPLNCCELKRCIL